MGTTTLSMSINEVRGNLCHCFSFCLYLALMVVSSASRCSPDEPPTWPEVFTVTQRKWGATGNSSVVTYYDWPRRANLIIDTPDAKPLDPLWDLELGTGDSFYAHPLSRTCSYIKMPVGVLRPDWLA